MAASYHTAKILCDMQDLFVSFSGFAAVLYGEQLHMQNMCLLEKSIITLDLVQQILLATKIYDDIHCIHIQIFPCKGGQVSDDSSILSSHRCCHDNRAQRSCPPRDGKRGEKTKRRREGK